MNSFFKIQDDGQMNPMETFFSWEKRIPVSKQAEDYDYDG